MNNIFIPDSIVMVKYSYAAIKLTLLQQQWRKILKRNTFLVLCFI